MTAKKTDEPTAPHVYVAINEVTAAISRDGIAKGRANTAQNYNFRGIDDVYNALSGPLSVAKLLMLPRVLTRTVTERTTKGGAVMSYVVLDVEFDFVSAIDGSKHTIRTMGEAMDSADKATNKAMSAAMKYACLMAFQIPTEGDNDADATTHEIRAAPADPRQSGIFIACKAAIDICDLDEAKLNAWKADNEAGFKNMDPDVLTEVKRYWQLQVKAAREKAKAAQQLADIIPDSEIPF